jgi:hypothetical protein
MILRFLPVLLSVAFAALIAVLVLTPLAWNLMGRPNETYPELFYLAFGAPPALFLLMGSTAIALLGAAKFGGPMRPALRPLWYCIAASVAIAAFVLTPVIQTVPESSRQLIASSILGIAWPALFILTGAATMSAWNRRTQ